MLQTQIELQWIWVIIITSIFMTAKANRSSKKLFPPSPAVGFLPAKAILARSWGSPLVCISLQRKTQFYSYILWPDVPYGNFLQNLSNWHHNHSTGKSTFSSITRVVPLFPKKCEYTKGLRFWDDSCASPQEACMELFLKENTNIHIGQLGEAASITLESVCS